MVWAAFSRKIAMAAGVLASVAALTTDACAQASAMNSVCFDSSDKVRLCYSAHLLAEDAARPILVFIPGWTMPAAIWEKQLSYFSGKYSLVAFDPRGQGASAAPRVGYTLDRRVKDLKELLDRFPERRFILVGWSLAVLESLAFVDRYGDSRLRGLVLVDNSIGEGSPPPARNGGKNPFFEELRTQREETMAKFVAAMFRQDPGAEMRQVILASALKTEVEDSIRLLSYGKPRTYWKDAVYRTRLPIGYLVTPKWSVQAKALLQKHPNASVKIFEQSGHALFWDEADAFNRALDDFILKTSV